MFLVVESTGHEHYRTGHIAAAVGNCYLIQFDKMEGSEAPPLPPMELYTLEELSRTRWRLSRDCCAANHWNVARETNVSIARLSEWRERALAGAATALKERERDDRDDEIARLKSKVGEITMDNELLYAKIEALEGKRPLAHRRSRR